MLCKRALLTSGRALASLIWKIGTIVHTGSSGLLRIYTVETVEARQVRLRTEMALLRREPAAASSSTRRILGECQGLTRPMSKEITRRSLGPRAIFRMELRP